MKDDDPLSGSSDEDQKESTATPRGTLVISTWNEPGQADSFRARVTYGQDVDAQPASVTYADPEEVLGFVRRWVFARSGSPDKT
jgi:hypothetical protein